MKNEKFQATHMATVGSDEYPVRIGVAGVRVCPVPGLQSFLLCADARGNELCLHRLKLRGIQEKAE